MFDEIKESLWLEKKLRKAHVCRYNNKEYIIQHSKVRLFRLFLISFMMLMLFNFIADKFVTESNYKEKVDIVYSNNSNVNYVIDSLVSIGISIVIIAIMNFLARLFWKIIAVIKSSKYSDDFLIYDLKYKNRKARLISKYDYIFGIIFSTLLIGLLVFLLDTYIKYHFFTIIYLIVFIHAISVVYLLFQKCEYILLSLSGCFYLSKKED